MDDKYQNKYRIASTRLQNWDYGRNGSYFITICTKNREYFFGDIVVVETTESGVSTTETTEPIIPNGKKPIGGKNKQWKPGTLGTIINQYKRICTIQARKINPDFAWQSRFYDHIIRNRKSYRRISQYIENNPIKWEGDKLNRLNGLVS